MDLDQVKAVDDFFIKAMAEKNIDQMANIYTDDAVAINMNTVLHGKQEIRESFASLFEAMELGAFEIVEEHRHLEGSLAASLVVFKGTATLKATGEEIPMIFRALDVRKKQPDGSWKIVLDHTSVPAALGGA